MPLNSHVSTASGQKILVAEGTRLVFGRGPGVDLIVAAGRGLSRRAGLVTAMAAGAWIANISRTHALYVEGDGYQVRLPRMEHDGEPANGWFVHAGTALVGSRAMLDDGQSLVVTVTGRYVEGAISREAGLAGEAGLTGTGLHDDGEWTDEVYAASTSRQTELSEAGPGPGGRSTAAMSTAGPGPAAREGSGLAVAGTAGPGRRDPGRADPGRANPGRAGRPGTSRRPGRRTGRGSRPGTATARCCRSTWTR